MTPDPTRDLSHVTMDDVRRAAQFIAPHAHRTPVVTCQTLNQMSGHQLFFKCENLQKTGAFKFRGAINSMCHLSKAERAKGVVTHSSGNHAQALAAAAARFGVAAHIVMPSTAPTVKKNGVIGYGGKVYECEPTLDARIEVSERVRLETGATLIPPFNHPDVIAGQGTCAMEFLEEIPDLDFVVAPVGGGGLISGTCVATAALSTRARVIAAEPAGADDAFQSKTQNRLIPQTNPKTIADGLLTSLGDLTWPFVRDVVHAIQTVSDEEIMTNLKLFLERTKIVIEPSAAVSVAVAMKPNFTDRPSKIGVILSGGNVDFTKLKFE